MRVASMLRGSQYTPRVHAGHRSAIGKAGQQGGHEGHCEVGHDWVVSLGASLCTKAGHWGLNEEGVNSLYWMRIPTIKGRSEGQDKTAKARRKGKGSTIRHIRRKTRRLKGEFWVALLVLSKCDCSIADGMLIFFDSGWEESHGGVVLFVSFYLF